MIEELSLYAEITSLLDLYVDLIIENKVLFFFFPSIKKVELKILCLQCSELICENIISSTSVGSLLSFR